MLEKGSPPKRTSSVARQSLLRDYDSDAIHKSKILLVGCGQINSEFGHGCVRKGVGEIFMCDPDTVEISNLDKQLYFPGDIGKPKAFMLTKNLAKNASRSSVIGGFSMTFERFLEDGIDKKYNIAPDVIIVGVDRDSAIVNVTKYLRKNNKKGIVISIGLDAASGYVFIHENTPDSPCWGCIFTERAENVIRNGSIRSSCAGSLIDAPKAAAGYALFTIDTILQPKARQRMWNYKFFSFFGNIQERYSRIERNPVCPLCSGENR